MIPDRYILAAALAIVQRHGDDAKVKATQRADHLLAEGNMADAEIWHRILNAIERLQANGEKVH